MLNSCQIIVTAIYVSKVKHILSQKIMKLMPNSYQINVVELFLFLSKL